MARVAKVNGKALEVRWMVDEEGRNVSVNVEHYLNILKQVWEQIRFCTGSSSGGCKMEHGLTRRRTS